MALRARVRGRTAARAKGSPAARAFLDKLAPFFAGSEISGGPMLVATVLTLLIINTAWGPAWERFWATPLQVEFGDRQVSETLAEWIDHALLPLFFIIIGTDVKRELVKGALSSWKSAALPLLAALGGMAVPVLLFLLIAGRGEGAAGWGAVVVSDTAFALALLAIFARDFPAGLRAVLLAFAAIDDIGGLLVIAGAYTRQVQVTGLLVAAVAFALMLGLRRLHWVAALPYVLLAMAVWGGIFASGIHSTIAGVLIGLVAPVEPRLGEDAFADRVQERIDAFRDAHHEMQSHEGDGEAQQQARGKVEAELGYLDEMTTATDVSGERLVGILTPWVSYIVLPLFVMSNVHIILSPEAIAQAFSSALAPAVTIALVVGKPIGFLALAWIGTRIGIATLPHRVTWPMMAAIGGMAGIGFTISLFIADMAFSDERLVEQASLGVLTASILSGLIGYALLRIQARRRS